MLEEDRDCVDVLQEVHSMQDRLHGGSRELLRDQLTPCATRTFTEDGEAGAEVIEKLVELS